MHTCILYPTYTLDHLFLWSVAGKTAWSVDINGPSMPSMSTTSTHPELHPSIHDGFWWNKVCRCLLYPWKLVSTTLNHQKWSKNAKCMSFITIPYSVYGIPSNKAHRPLLYYSLDISSTQSVWKNKEMMVFSQNGRQRPQKKKVLAVFVFLALPPMLQEWQKCEPFKVNISWFMVIFLEFQVQAIPLGLSLAAGKGWLIILHNPIQKGILWLCHFYLVYK